MFLNSMFILSALITGTNTGLLPKLDEKYHDNNFLNEETLLKHNSKQNIECIVEDLKFYEFTDHNFHTPKYEQVEDKTGFYQSMVFINQEIEYAKNQYRLNYCLGAILNPNYVITFTSCLKPTKLKTVIKYGAISNNCSACPITIAKNIISNKEISLIHLKFGIKYNKRKESSISLSQPVGPSCISNLNNRNLSLLNWSLLVTHGLNNKKIDRIFHKPIQFERLSKQLITISHKSDKVVSESFIFKEIDEKLFLIGLCDLRKYDNYYCYNINKYKKFISDTIGTSIVGRSLAAGNSQWKVFNLEDTKSKKKECS